MECGVECGVCVCVCGVCVCVECVGVCGLCVCVCVCGVCVGVECVRGGVWVWGRDQQLVELINTFFTLYTQTTKANTTFC